jgi:hypothetical protein
MGSIGLEFDGAFKADNFWHDQGDSRHIGIADKNVLWKHPVDTSDGTNRFERQF